MKKTSILGLLAAAALFSAAPVSLQISQDKLSVSLDGASARIGEPLSAGSVAGVHRRAGRRAARGAYYGGYDNAGYGYGGVGVGVGVVSDTVLSGGRRAALITADTETADTAWLPEPPGPMRERRISPAVTAIPPAPHSPRVICRPVTTARCAIRGLIGCASDLPPKPVIPKNGNWLGRQARSKHARQPAAARL